MPAGRSITAMIPLLFLAGPAVAHTSSDLGGFTSGVLHPIGGLDHVVAMVAVGLWGSILGAPAKWLLPVAFPLMMACAGAAGAAGLPLPGVEIGIALSGIVLGLLVLAELRLPVAAALIITAGFAIFHGHAHGTELPASADPMLYAVGFVLATGALHLCGMGLGLLRATGPGRLFVRATGGAIALAGAAFLTGVA